ncbi:MAG: hypothetical protein Ta2A_20860 [Treponemataceae bacterium]|nr:MAG: hypothetical protein Ta2A_20860 [Treponemataceae bacterium]
MLRLVFRSADEQKCVDAAVSAAQILHEKLRDSRDNLEGTGGSWEKVEILGPAPCPLEKIALNYRMQILLRSPKIAPLQELSHHLLNAYKSPAGVYAECDVDPVSLL